MYIYIDPESDSLPPKNFIPKLIRENAIVR